MDHLIALIQQYGLGFVFLNVLALQAGLPLPAYPTLMVAGALAAAGGTPVYQLIGVGVVGALIADTGWYSAGRSFGMRILSTLCRVSLSQDTCVRQTESIFQRFGPSSMLFAKFVPGFPRWPRRWPVRFASTTSNSSPSTPWARGCGAAQALGSA